MKFIIYLLGVLIILSSCSKQEKKISEDQSFNIDPIIQDVVVDLNKIDRSLINKTFTDTIFEAYKNNFEQLEKDIDSLIKVYPNSYNVLDLKLRFLTKEGKDQVLLDYLGKRYQDEKDNLLVRYFYALIQEDAQKGLSIYGEMIEKYPDNYLGYLGYGQKLAETPIDDLENVGKLFFLAALKTKNELFPHYNLGKVFEFTEQIDSKAVLDGIILVKDPSNYQAFNSLISYNIGFKKDTLKAKEVFDVFQKNNPKLLSSWDKSRFNLMLGNYKDALTYIEQERMTNETGKAMLLYFEARAHTGLKNYKKAVELLNEFYMLASDREKPYISDPEFKNNLMEYEGYKELLKKFDGPSEGDKAIELGGRMSNGNFFNPASVRNKVYLISFWVEWCQPCKEEMPNLIEIYQEFKDKGFEIIGVNLDTEQNIGKVQKYIEEQDLKWPLIVNLEGWNDKNASNYGVRGVPMTFLVDKKGIVRYKSIRGKDNLINKINELLGE